MDIQVRRRRAALCLLFLIPGLLLASWVTRTPDIRDLLLASTSEMGLILFGLSSGAMCGVLASGKAVQLRGTRPVAAIGTALVFVGTLGVALGASVSMAPGVFLGLFCIGAGMGLGEIAINIEGAEVERITARPLLPVLHGCFSLGTLCGALLSMGLAHLALSVVAHLIIMAGLCAPAAIWACRQIPANVGRETPRAANDTGVRSGYWAVWRDRKLVFIGLIVLALAMAEGSATDWLPLLMVDGHGFDPASSALIYAGFAGAMTIGRFCGNFVLARVGRETVIRGCALFGGAGLALVIFSDNAWLAAAAVILWGIGASLGFPVGISAAGDDPQHGARRVSAVATLGYLAFLVGPPSLGFLGEAYGLRSALLVVMVLVASTFLMAPAVKARPRAEASPG
ncbi:MFS transporter [Pseudomonas sp. Marseille-QA0892]